MESSPTLDPGAESDAKRIFIPVIHRFVASQRKHFSYRRIVALCAVRKKTD